MLLSLALFYLDFYSSVTGLDELWFESDLVLGFNPVGAL